MGFQKAGSGPESSLGPEALARAVSVALATCAPVPCAAMFASAPATRFGFGVQALVRGLPMGAVAGAWAGPDAMSKNKNVHELANSSIIV